MTILKKENRELILINYWRWSQNNIHAKTVLVCKGKSIEFVYLIFYYSIKVKRTS